MRELTISEMAQVGGGGFLGSVMDWAHEALDWAHVGGEFGGIAGFIVKETAKGAARGGLVGAAASLSFYAGYSAGSFLYEALCG